MARGKFLTFEGPEGSGKSTQSGSIVTFLKAQGLEVLHTREPGGTSVGEAIRNLLQHDVAGDSMDPLAELLLFQASRAQLVNTVIEPALSSGTWVVCDRFIDSTVAYQGYARGFDLSVIHDLNARAIGGCLPDLTVLVDVTVEEGFSRIGKRYESDEGRKDRFEREARSFHEKVREGYLALAAESPGRVALIDGARSIEDVYADIESRVHELIG